MSGAGGKHACFCGERNQGADELIQTAKQEQKRLQFSLQRSQTDLDNLSNTLGQLDSLYRRVYKRKAS